MCYYVQTTMLLVWFIS